MERREFLAGAAAAAVWLVGGRASAQADPLASLLGEVEADPQMIEAGWLFREPSVSRGVGRGKPSTRKLSQDSIDVIIAFEVASPAAYQARYRRPIWPKGQSGVTIGVGYDLRFANKHYVDRDWPMLSQADRELLYTTVGLSGTRAQQALASVRSVDVPWDAAKKQFLEFLPYPTHDTEGVFPNSGSLADDSFGALVSLVYNRGAAVSRNSQKRLEMYQIQQLMVAKKFDAIPDRIRAMKRIWAGDPNARGLLKRREAEALLFEKGLRSAG